MTGWRADIGRRGAALLILAAADAAYGLALLAGYIPASIAAELAPPSTWGTLWLLTAILLATAAFSPVDRLAFALATLVKFGWAALIVADLAEHGTEGGWGPAVPWLALAGLLLLISGWPEP